jgi:DNA-binding HxlR family transcriptional regulator
VGERWTLLILRDAFYGVQRFNDFHAHLDIPKAGLADRLRSSSTRDCSSAFPTLTTRAATCTA